MSLDLTAGKSTLVKEVNGLVPSGNKPLPEPMLTQFYDAKMAPLGHNESINHIHINN